MLVGNTAVFTFVKCLALIYLKTFGKRVAVIDTTSKKTFHFTAVIGELRMQKNMLLIYLEHTSGNIFELRATKACVGENRGTKPMSFFAVSLLRSDDINCSVLHFFHVL